MTPDLEGLYDAAMAFLGEIDDAAERKRRADRSRRAARYGGACFSAAERRAPR